MARGREDTRPGLDIHRHTENRPQNKPLTLQEGASEDVLCKSDARLRGGFTAPRTSRSSCLLGDCLGGVTPSHMHKSETLSPVPASVQSQGSAPCPPGTLSPSGPGPQRNPRKSVPPTASQPDIDPDSLPSRVTVSVNGDSVCAGIQGSHRL